MKQIKGPALFGFRGYTFILLALLGMAGTVWATAYTETFTSSSSYSFSDSLTIGIQNGAAKLLVRKPFHLHDTKTDFDGTGAVYSDTEISTTDVGAAQSGIKASDSGLVAYYPFNGTTGAIVNNSTAGLEDTKSTNEGAASNVNGTGLAFAAGKFGNGVSFDGVDDYVNITGVPTSIGSGSMSASAWFKTSATAVQTVMQIGSARGSHLFFVSTGATLRWTFYTGVNDYGTIDVAVDYTDGQWHHVVTTFDGTTGRVYVDGALAASGAASTPGGFYAEGTGAWIGRYNYNDYFFLGLIDDVAIYNRALTASEIAAQFAAGVGVHMKASASLAPHAPKLAAGYPGLVSYWSLDHSSGTTAADLVGANKGTLTGFVTPTWTAGVNGNALSFDGVDDYVSVGGRALGSSFTISAWVKPNSLTGKHPIISAGYYSGNSVLLWQSNDAVSFTLRPGGNVDATWTGVSTDTWQHVLGVYDGANISLYVNGVRVAGPTALSSFAHSASSDWYFGRTMNTVDDGFFAGSIDEVAIFDRALAAGEVAYLAGKKGETATYTSPVMDGEIAAAAWDKIRASVLHGAGEPVFTSQGGYYFIGDPADMRVAAGDLNGDGAADFVYGKSAGTPANITVYFYGKRDAYWSASYTAVSTTVFTRDVEVGDLTGDKALDIVVADNVNGGVKWFKNSGAASPTFAEQTAAQISTDASPQAVAIGDIDGDGFNDVVAGYTGAVDKIVWYKSDGASSPTFTAQTAVATGFDVEHLTVKDINADGSLDIAAASKADNKLAWFKGNGGSSWTAVNINTTAGTAWSYVGIADMDRDGTQDIVAAGYTLSWWPNDASATPAFSTKNDVAASNGSIFYYAVPVDYDSDGAMDIMSSRYDGTDRVQWWKNNGAQSFTPNSLDQSIGGAVGDFAAADIDGDGLLDQIETQHYVLFARARQPFKEVTIAGLNQGRDVFPADLTGDGLLDFLVAFGDGAAGNIGYYKQTSAGVFGALTNQLACPNPTSLVAADLNEDGKKDMLAVCSDGLYYWAQGANPDTWTKNTVDAAITNGQAIAVALDGGRTDILVAGTGKVVWYKQNETTAGQFDAQTAIEAVWTGAKAVHEADVDADGLMDVLAANGAEVAWWRQTSAGVFGTKSSIDTDNDAYQYLQSLATADLNGDGNPDVITGDYNSFGYAIQYYLNNGNGTFGARTKAGDASYAPSDVAAADFNGDGLIDLAASTIGSYFYWFENLGGLSFQTRVLNHAGTSAGQERIAIADMDGDGLMDIIRVRPYYGVVEWLRQRPIAQVRLQARTDTSSTMANNPGFVGPDGTAASSFGATSPDGVGILAALDGKRYAQYKATFYRNDSTLDPMVKSVQADYTALPYSTFKPYITPNAGTAFTYLTGFTPVETKPAGTEIKYVLSPNDGTNWYYHNGGWTASDGTYSQASDQATVGSNIAAFDNAAYAAGHLPENSTGTLKYRALLYSNGNDTPALDQLDIGYQVGSITMTSPSDGTEIWKRGTTKQIAWTGTGVIPSDLTLEYSTDGTWVSPTTIATGVQSGWSLGEKDPATISGVVGVWRFAEGAGQTAADGSGSGSTATLGVSSGADANDPTWTTSGRWGNALTFDGSNDYMGISNPTNFDFGLNNFSISAWIKGTGASSNYRVIVGHWNYGGGFELTALITSGHLSASIGSQDAGTLRTVNGTIDVLDNNWHHVAAIRNAANLTLYVDGAADGTIATVASSTASGPGTPVRIGMNLSNYPFQGQIDEVAIFDRALTAEEITELAGGGSPSYNWAIPADFTPSNMLKVRARSLSVPAIRDASNANFTIADLNIVSPNGGQFWNVTGGSSTTQNITWNATNFVPDDLRLEFSTDGGSSWNGTPIVSGLNHTSGTPYPWTIPAAAVSAQTRVRVRSLSATDLDDMSNANFTVYNLKITSPNTAVNWPAGSAQNITWTQSELPGATVKLQVSTDAPHSVWTDFAAGIAKTNLTYSWTVPSTFVSTARVRIVDESNAAVLDDSDTDFTINGHAINVTQPAAAEVLGFNTLKRINWNVTGAAAPAGAKVKIEYSSDGLANTDPGKAWNLIDSNVLVDYSETGGCDGGATGCLDWTVDQAAVSNTVVIRVKDNQNDNASWSSIGGQNAADGFSGVFRVTGTLAIIKPNGGEKWAADAAHTVSYQVGGSITNVKLYYATSADSYASWTEIDPAVTKPANGSYTWTPPRAIAAANMKVRVTNAADLEVSDDSNAAFTLAGVTVTAPNAAARVKAGDPYTVTWTQAGIANVKIEYTLNNGGQWTTLAASQPVGANSLAWPSGLPLSTTAEFKVRVSDADAVPPANGVDTALATDVSDASSVIFGRITVVVPNGGENWSASNPHDITWTVSPAGAGVVPSVKIFYTTSSFAASTVEADPGVSKPSNNNPGAGTGKYSWSPPFTSTSVKVRVVDANDPAVSGGTAAPNSGENQDDSNAVFTISGLSITAPTAGASWPVGSQQLITTGYTGTFNNAKIEYAVNGGAYAVLGSNTFETSTDGNTWTPFNGSGANVPVPANPFRIRWTVPDQISTNVKLRVTECNVDGTLPPSPAQAETPAITITGGLAVPNPGTLTVGAAPTIAWTKTGTIGTVDVHFSPSGNFGGGADTVLIGTGLTGTSTSWTVPDNIGIGNKIRVTDTVAGHPATVNTSTAFTIKGGFAFTSPTGSTKFGVASSPSVTWSNSGSMSTVKLEYATDASGDNFTTWTQIATGIANSGATGSTPWTNIPDVVILGGNTPNAPSPIATPTNGSRSVKLRITDLAHSGAAQAQLVSPQFTVKYWLITFNVTNADGNNLANLTVSDSVNWDDQTATLTSPTQTKRHYKDSATETATFSKTNFTATTTTFTPDADKTVNAVLESETPTPFQVNLLQSYSATTDLLSLSLTLAKSGNAVTTLASLGASTLTIYDTDGVAVLAPLTEPAPDANGVYKYTAFTPSLYGLSSGNSYLAKCVILYNGTAKTSIASINFTSAAQTQQIITAIGTAADAAGANTLFGKIEGVNVSAQAAQTASQATQAALGAPSDTAAANTLFGKEAAVLQSLGVQADAPNPKTVQARLGEIEKRVHKPAAALQRTLDVPPGGEAKIRFKTDTGLVPTADVYDAANNKILTGVTMKEIGATGVYEYKWAVSKTAAEGDYTVVMKESVNGSLDSMTVRVKKNDAFVGSAGVDGNAVQTTNATTQKTFEDVKSVQSKLDNLMTKLEGAQALKSGDGGWGNGENIVLHNAEQALTGSKSDIKSIAAEQGIRLDDKLLELSEEQKKKMGEQEEEIKVLKDHVVRHTAILEALQRAAGTSDAVVKQWYERGSLIIKVLAINPSKDMDKEVPIRTYLPTEVKPENIINRDEVVVGFDTTRSLFYVEKNVKLKPGETYTLQVHIEDIWNIPSERLEKMTTRAAAAMKRLEGTSSGDVGKLLHDNVLFVLQTVRARQEDDSLLPEAHIAAYRMNVVLIDEAAKDLESLEALVISGPGREDRRKGLDGQSSLLASVSFTWKIMAAIILFLGILSGASFMIWEKQIKELVQPKDINVLPPEHRTQERSPTRGISPKKL